MCLEEEKRFWYPSIYLMIIKYMVLKSHIDQASDPV